VCFFIIEVCCVSQTLILLSTCFRTQDTIQMGVMVPMIPQPWMYPFKAIRMWKYNHMKCLNLLWPTSHVPIMCPCVIIVFDDGLISSHGISGVAKKGDTWHLGTTYTNVDSNHSHLFNLHKLHIEMANHFVNDN
jgi:hypothetical protein